jgi:GNAT superfamily N-acetyltransferase
MPRAERARGARVTIEPDASAEEVAVVQAGLRAFNRAYLGEPNEAPVACFVRDACDRIVGGLVGHTKWGWLFVAKLWVDESVRGMGFGTELLEAAEELARTRGCIGAYLDTFEHQARPFYEKKGYSLFGTLEGHPPGYRQYFLFKRWGLDE